MIQLQLQESYCLPLLTYAFPTLNVNAAQIQQLNVCWNSVYRKKFTTIRVGSVKCCVKGLGRMDSVHMLALQKLKFYRRLKRSCNDTVCKIFLFTQLSNECAPLFATYSCRKSDNVYKLCMRMEDHFARACAAREAVM